MHVHAQPMLVPLVLSLIHSGSPLLPVLTQVAQLIKFLTALCIPLPRVPISCVNQALKPSSIQVCQRRSKNGHLNTSDTCWRRVLSFCLCCWAGLLFNLNVFLATVPRYPRQTRKKRAQVVHASNSSEQAAATRFQDLYGWVLPTQSLWPLQRLFPCLIEMAERECILGLDGPC
jgi:hypothetical protein